MQTCAEIQIFHLPPQRRPSIPSSQGKAPLFSPLPEGPLGGLGNQLLETLGVWVGGGPGLWWGVGGPSRFEGGYHLCLSTKWSVLLPLLFR